MFGRARLLEVLLCTGVLVACASEVDDHIDQGNQLAKRGQLSEAEGHFSKALTLAPTSQRALVNVLHVQMAQAKWAEASATATTLTALPNPNTDATLAIAAVDLHEKRYDAVLSRLAGQPPTLVTATELRVRALLARGAPADAMAALALIEAISAPSGSTLLLKGFAQLANGQFAAAQTTFERLEKQPETAAFAAFGLAKVAAAQRRAPDAMVYLRTAQRAGATWWSPQAVQGDPAFAFLLDDPTFQQLMVAQ